MPHSASGCVTIGPLAASQADVPDSAASGPSVPTERINMTMNIRRRVFHRWLAVAGVLLCAAAVAQTPAPPASAPSARSSASGASPAPDALTVTPAGKVELVTGEVRIVRSGSAPRRVSVGDTVNEGDLLATGKDSEVQMTMQDSGYIALRASTRLRIVQYKADGGDDDKGVFSLLVGGMRSVTGWIGKYNQAAYQVRTPSATIGIRGTDHETRYIPEGSSDGEAGTYDKVFAGGTTIHTAGGQAEVAPNQAGFVSLQGREAPRVLDRVPGFFRPGPNETQINQKHAEIQAQIVQRRDERRKVVLEKRAALDAARTNLQSQVEANKAANEQRRAAAPRQKQDTEQQRQALREQAAKLQEQQKSIQERAKALQQSREAGARIPRGQGQALRQDAKAARESREALDQARKRLVEQNTRAKGLRQQAIHLQRGKVQSQIEDLKQKQVELQKEREATQLEIRTLMEEEQKRFRAERQADRQLRAPAPGPGASAPGQ